MIEVPVHSCGCSGDLPSNALYRLPTCGRQSQGDQVKGLSEVLHESPLKNLKRDSAMVAHHIPSEDFG